MEKDSGTKDRTVTGADEEETPPAPDPTRNGSDAEESVLDRLKAKRERIRLKKEIDLDIPGYDGELVGRFKRMPWEQLKKIAENADASRSNRKELNGHADVLATACEVLLIRRELDGKEVLTPLQELFPDDFGGNPARFDERLAKWLGLEIDGNRTARKVVLAVYANDLAVTAMHNDLGEWMQSSKSEEDKDFS
jgi:hypothetical protein